MLPEAELDIYVVGETLTERVNQAWDCLLDAGRALAQKHGVAPEELILSRRIPNNSSHAPAILTSPTPQ